MLSFRKAFELTIDAAEQGDPLIYSVEVEGSDTSLVQIEADQRSREFAAASESDKGSVPRTENPFPSTGPYVDPDVQDMDSGEVYEQIEFLGQMAPDVPRQ